MAELDAGGNVQALNTFGANGLVSRHTAATGASVFYTFDERGNVAQRLDSGGNILSTDLYDAFGNRTGTTTPATTSSGDPWGFGGQWGYQTDNETGLVLCTNRYYDPQQGRFLTRDPMGYGGGVNLYSYTQNNPVNYVDPSGYIGLDELEYEAQGLPPGARNLANAGLLAIGLGVIAYEGLRNVHWPSWNPPWSHPTTAFPGEIPHPAPPNYASDRGGKSRSEWDKHQKGLADALAREKELMDKLAKTKGNKERGPIEDALENLRNGKNGIKGHRKEIGQKWPNGCPTE